MSQPPVYTRQYDFSDYQDDFPDDPLPGNQVDIELNAVRTSLNAAIANLGLIQADDGGLVNQIVMPESLSNDALALLSNGLDFKGDWVTATAYEVADTVRAPSGATYVCIVAHTSGTFDTDLAAGKWLLLANPVGSLGAIVFAAHSGDGATTVFSLPYAIQDEKQLFVFVSGDITNPETAYTVAGTNITFAVAPPSGTNNILIFGVDITAAVAANEAAASAAAAATSATNASASATSAASSATTATTQATNASNSASAAATSASAASTSASAASTSASSASTSASAASTSATNAASSATTATTQATNAANSATTATTQATNAASSASAASTSASSASTSATNAASSATSASNSASTATTQATNASSSATSAAASAAAAAATLASALWRDVVFLTSADSPKAIASGDNGKLFVCDTSSGAITITLPQISTLTMPFQIGIKKESSDSTAVTINRSSTDTIDGSTSKTISTATAGCVLIADTDPSPDIWTAADFGAVAGNMTVDKFSGTGAQTTFTLSVAPGSVNNVAVFISGVRQTPTTDYTVSSTTLTMTTAPASGTNNVLAITGTTLAIGTPADLTVTTAKIVDSAVTTAKINDGAVTSAKIADGTITASDMAAPTTLHNAGTAGGTANAQTLTPTPALGAYAAGVMYSFLPVATNTSGTVTMAVSGLATRNIKKFIGGAVVVLAVGDLIINQPALIVDDGTQFILMNPQTYTQGADVASAGTTNLDTATGDYVHVTGTTTITAITLSQGRQCKVVFDGALTLTHNATSLILPGGANITTAAGDVAVFRGEASGNVRCVEYNKKDGTAVVGSSPTAAAQSDQETATSTTLMVTPGRQQFHPSAAKCWAFVSQSGTTPTLSVSYNITSITDTATGDLMITIATDFSSANWCALIANDGLGPTTAHPATTVINNRAAGTIEIFDYALTASTTWSTDDPDQGWHFVGFGDQ